MTQNFYFDTALLPSGWCHKVRIQTLDGWITQIDVDAAPEPGDISGAIAIPGLPNLHSHAFQRAMAGLVEQLGPHEGDNFWSWRELMYRFLDRLDADDIEAVAAYAYADMLEAGFTSVGEFHYVHRTPDGALYDNPAELALRHLAAAARTGLGITMLPVFYAASDFGGAAPTVGQRRFITNLDTFATILDRVDEVIDSKAGQHAGFAPHSLRAVTPDHLAALVRLRHHGPVHIHIAEQLKEVHACHAWSGQHPVEWLLDHAEVDARWCLVHATHLSPTELNRLAASGAVTGLCPITEANLGDGVFPCVEYNRQSGRWGIGTDSNVLIDAAGELRQLEYSQRLTLHTRNALATPHTPSTGRHLFESALAGGAQALGQPVGAIAPAHRADILVLDERHPDLAGRSGDAILDTWLFAVGRDLIDRVIAGGRVVVGQHRHHDREQINANYCKVLSRLLD